MNARPLTHQNNSDVAYGEYSSGSSISSDNNDNRVDFPNHVKVQSLEDAVVEKDVSKRVSTAMAALTSEIKSLEKAMIEAGQDGDFRTAHSKDSKRATLMRHRSSLSMSADPMHHSSSDSISMSSRESILHVVEDQLGLSASSIEKKTNEKEKKASKSRRSKKKQSSRRDSSSRDGSQKGDKQKDSLVVLVNDLLHTAPDTVKEDFSNGVVYRKTNDDRLNTIYEREKKLEAQEEDCIRVSDLPITDPYGDFAHYTGMATKNKGVPHGLGRLLYEDGRTYEGDWRYGQWHGFGRSTCTNGDFYEGEYRQDQRHGFGVYKWSDGRVYQGDFYKDKRHGRGIFKWPSGAVYQGGFVMGMQEGRGKITYDDKTVEVGEWIGGKLQKVEGSNSLSSTDVSSSMEGATTPQDSVLPFTTHNRKSSFFSEASTESSATEWVCSLCTYVNNDPLHLSCAVCGYARNYRKPGNAEEQEPENEEYPSFEEEQSAFMEKQKSIREIQDWKVIEDKRLKEMVAVQNELMEEIQHGQDGESA